MSETCGFDCAKCLPAAFNFELEKPPVQVVVNQADGIHVAQITVPVAGTYVPQHSHAYDHMTMLATGSMRVWVEGDLVGDFDAPIPLKIPAGKKHTFLALTDNVTFYCLHNVGRTGAVEELEQHELAPTVLRELDDSVSIREERFAPFWADAQKLIAEHAAEIGPREGVTLDVNTGLFARLDQIGALQIVTARSNGRLFGYLVSIVAPSLENAALKQGTQTAFYVSRDYRGLGTKIMRASIGRLREKGVNEIIMRAGVRGSGPKAGALYRRLGAAPFGELYSLMLDAA